MSAGSAWVASIVKAARTLETDCAPGQATETHSRGCARLNAGSSAVASLR